MLSRRLLRIKVFHALYAFFQSEDKNAVKIEKELFLSLERMYDLYLLLLIIGKELIHHSTLKMEDGKLKKLPSEEDLNPNTKFVNNHILELINNNYALNEVLKTKKLSWDADQELLGKLLNYIRKHDIYITYMSTKETSFEEDQKFIVALYKKIIPEFELLIQELQDKSIFWGYDDIDFALSMVLKTIKSFTKKSDKTATILGLYRDEKEDIPFARDLFKKTINNNSKYTDLIDKKTKNWEVDRIAMVDVLLMKMALTELLNFKSIPVKATLNEYIELSKWYSTPKSKVFINGVLDKLVAELKASGELKKTGRGLIEG